MFADDENVYFLFACSRTLHLCQLTMGREASLSAIGELHLFDTFSIPSALAVASDDAFVTTILAGCADGRVWEAKLCRNVTSSETDGIINSPTLVVTRVVENYWLRGRSPLLFEPATRKRCGGVLPRWVR